MDKPELKVFDLKEEAKIQCGDYLSFLIDDKLLLELTPEGIKFNREACNYDEDLFARKFIDILEKGFDIKFIPIEEKDEN